MRQHKYGARKTTVDGVTFDSQREAQRYQELKLLERAEVISGLELQPRFELQPKFRDSDGKMQRPIYYVADFAYNEPGCGKRIIEEVKGYKENRVWMLKHKMFLFKYPNYILRVVD